MEFYKKTRFYGCIVWHFMVNKYVKLCFSPEGFSEPKGQIKNLLIISLVLGLPVSAE